jgi:hypothetical protein
MHIPGKLATSFTSGFLVVGLLLGGLAVAPVGAAPAPDAGVAISAPVVASAVTMVPLATKKPRATLSATWEVVAASKVKVAVRTNAKKVKLAYRTAKGAKRTATIKIRKGVGTRTLAKGSKKIKAQALATSKLRASLWRTVPKLVPPAAPAALRFNLVGAVGLARGGSVSASSQPLSTSALNVASGATDLFAVAIDGTLHPAIASGSANVSGILTASNGSLFVSFSPPARIGVVACALAQVDRTTGVPTCIDPSLGGANWNLGMGRGGNPPVQVDAAGAIYYSGYTMEGRVVLRRLTAGSVTDLLPSDVNLHDFLVLPDGSVFVTGRTTATGTLWTRRISAQGGVESLFANNAPFIRRFPDENVYMGVYGGTGVRRFLTADGLMDPVNWFSLPIMNPPEPAHVDIQTICSAASEALKKAFCDTAGSYILDAFPLPDGRVVAVAGSALSGGAVVQYYPTLAALPSSVQSISTAEAVGDLLVLGGLNGSAQNALTVLNTTTGAESQVLGAGGEVEVYHLTRVSGTDVVMFDGLRFADNTYVIGRLDTASMQIALAPAGSSRLGDFQTW